MPYRHRSIDGSTLDLPAGKVVCIGRNYLDHVRELNNPLPTAPVLFIKPATALVELEQPLTLPTGQGSCHHELELAVLIGRQLTRANPDAARGAVAGYALALDLTLRDLQSKLKSQGLPWELAKAFDGACPLSPFVGPDELPDLQNVELSLRVNGQLRQQGSTAQMLLGVFDLMAHISRHFTLLPGDVVLTGTPAGVAELRSGDKLTMTLAGRHTFTSRVA
ncbi:MAG: fumarylacetoacetate hydrolase family protein [Candidatus Competibacteraceae bacterium]|nr:fumarylacetoacetate hydrolase family protein [Candidatus Competibacteraceae bacterium]